MGAAFTHSATVAPKHSTQLAVQAVIEVTAELAEVREVPTKYFPHPSTGEQSIKVLALEHVHLSIW